MAKALEHTAMLQMQDQEKAGLQVMQQVELFV
jgi:hypothetical protein